MRKNRIGTIAKIENTQKMKGGNETMGTQTRPKRIAIVTYNRVGDGEFKNGVIRRDGVELYLAQNGHRSEWAAEPGVGTNKQRAETRAQMAKQVIGNLNLADMDHSYVYVGANGGEEAILQTRELEHDKLTYVMCGCNISRKHDMIRDFGNNGASTIRCECGGQETLGQIARKILTE
jgi:hypothetical protein